MGKLFKAVSESKHLCYPSLRSLVILNAPKDHIEGLDLSGSVRKASDVGVSQMRVRLPDIPGSSEYPRKPVHWLGTCTLDPAIRS